MKVISKRKKIQSKKARLTCVCVALGVCWTLLYGTAFANMLHDGYDDIFASETQHYISTSNNAQWNLVLVNPWNKLPTDFTVERVTLKNGHSIDKRIYPDLQAMMDAAREKGLSPVICSSYRTQEKQQALFDEQVSKYIELGYSKENAEKETGKWIAVPGTSEHQTGLAVDIVALSYQHLNEKQAETAEQQWLMENSYKYGFILRYNPDKSDITGIEYEPWHYRYVGQEVAKEIYTQGITLEEYLANEEINNT